MGPMHALRPYQLEIGRAIMDSVVRRRGLTLTVEIARQGGKNELSAQVETLLMTMSVARGGNLIKAAPTFLPQAMISMNRLRERLDEVGFAGHWHMDSGNAVVLGKARQIFLSAEPHANVVGNTAHILLEMDEAQSIQPEKYYKEFRPMGASTNVTTVLYGTPWDGHSLLDEAKEANLELERRDGTKRHFSVPWEEVAEYSPSYRKYVEVERERLGDDHPLFRTQYMLLPLAGGGGLFSAGQESQLQGRHGRRRTPAPGAVYVAGLDIGGGLAEGAGGAGTIGREPDSTVLTIGELDFSACDQIQREPAIRVVEQYCWAGVPHHSLVLSVDRLAEECLAVSQGGGGRYGHGGGRRQLSVQGPGRRRGDLPSFQRPEQVASGLRHAFGSKLRSSEDVCQGRIT